MFEDGDFQFELANFLSLPDTVDSGLPRPPAHPQYLMALLTGIMRGVGLIADVACITKHIYQVLAVEQVSVDAKEGGNNCCIYLAVEQVYYT